MLRSKVSAGKSSSGKGFDFEGNLTHAARRIGLDSTVARKSFSNLMKIGTTATKRKKARKLRSSEELEIPPFSPGSIVDSENPKLTSPSSYRGTATAQFRGMFSFKYPLTFNVLSPQVSNHKCQ